jgi:hypothetical protein
VAPRGWLHVILLTEEKYDVNEINSFPAEVCEME